MPPCVDIFNTSDLAASLKTLGLVELLTFRLSLLEQVSLCELNHSCVTCDFGRDCGRNCVRCGTGPGQECLPGGRCAAVVALWSLVVIIIK
jgi:hypothetical protein